MRKQFTTTSHSPSGERLQISSKAAFAPWPSHSSRLGPSSDKLAKTESTVAFLALRALHLELWISQIDNAFIALFHWDVAQATVHIELPCMIGTAKGFWAFPFRLLQMSAPRWGQRL